MSKQGNKKTECSEPITVFVTLDNLEKMLRLTNEALNPKVTFSDNMDAMREEAERTARQNIKVVRDTLSEIIQPTYHLPYNS